MNSTTVSRKSGPCSGLVLIGGHQPFLPDVRPNDLAGIWQALAGTPLHTALEDLKIHRFPTGLEICVPPVSLPRMRPVAAVRHVGGKAIAGTLLQSVPGWLMTAVHAGAALERGRRYDGELFLYSHIQELYEEIKRGVSSHVLRTSWTPGVQAQAGTDVTLGYNEVGVSPQVARRLLALVQQETGERWPTLDGLSAAGERFPVAGPYGIRWVVVRVLPHRQDHKLYMHPLALKELHGGDDDGDLLYLGVPPRPVRYSMPELPPVPRVRLYGSLPLSELVAQYDPALEDPEAALAQVDGARVKDLTGLLTYVFHRLAYSWSVGDTGGLTRAQVYREVFSIYFPLIEAVMDARKNFGADGPHRVRMLAQALGWMSSGERFDRRAFIPFLWSEPNGKALLKTLKRAWDGSESLQAGDLTLGGRLVGAGRRGLLRAVQTACRALNSQKVLPSELLAQFQRALLVPQEYPLPEQPGGESKSAVPLRVPRGSVYNFRDVFAQLKFGNRSVFPHVKEPWSPNGVPQIQVKFHPWWLRSEEAMQSQPDDPDGPPQGPLDWTLILPLFEIRTEPSLVESGHCWVKLPRDHEWRLYQPVFLLAEGEPKKETVYDTFQRYLLEQLVQFPERSLNANGAARLLAKATVRFVQDLGEPLDLDEAISVSSADEGDASEAVPPAAHTLACEEYRVHIPQYRDVVLGWEELQVLLGHLVREGWPLPGGKTERFDVLATRKGSPGSLVTRANATGRARYGRYLNPFYDWTPAKRRPEVREIGKALPLACPTRPTVTQKGKRLPEALQPLVTEVWVALADLNFNTFGGEVDPEARWTFDTLLATGDVYERLAVREECFPAGDLAEAEQLKERLLSLGVDPEQIELQTRSETIGYDGERNPIVRERPLLVVRGGLRDGGKVKGLVGPLKGVLTDLPLPEGASLCVRMPDGSLQPLHLIWPALSARKKQAVDLGLYLGAAKAGLTEVPVGQTLEQDLQLVQDGLQRAGFAPDGMQELVLVQGDGTEETLGRVLCGPLPVFRAPQTELKTTRFFAGREGVKLELHSLALLDLEHRPDVEAAYHFEDLAVAIRGSWRRYGRLKRARERAAREQAEHNLLTAGSGHVDDGSTWNEDGHDVQHLEEPPLGEVIDLSTLVD